MQRAFHAGAFDKTLGQASGAVAAQVVKRKKLAPDPEEGDRQAGGLIGRDVPLANRCRLVGYRHPGSHVSLKPDQIGIASRVWTLDVS